MVQKVNASSALAVNKRLAVRPWPVRVSVLLLALEGAGLCVIGMAGSAWLNRAHFGPIDQWLPQAGDALVITGIFTPVGLGALLAASGMLWRVRVSWLLAMLVQAISLLVCLQLYFTARPGFIYPVMVCSIVTVLYLNSYEVRVAFQAEPPSAPVEALDEA